MRGRRKKSRASNLLPDQRAIEQAAALLLRAIAQAMQPQVAGKSGDVQDATKELEPRHRRVPTAKSTVVPATREEVLKIAARLITLSRALDDLSLPLKVAGAWLPLTDIARFADRAQEYVCGLLALFDDLFATRPGVLETRGLPRNTILITDLELDGARKEIARLPRISGGTIELDIGPNYLPPEFRPEGYVENQAYTNAEITDENEPGDGEDYDGGEDGRRRS